MSEDKKQLTPTCPLCGKPTDTGSIGHMFRNGKDIYFVTFTCSFCDSQFTIYDNYKCALTRFSTRPESAWDGYRRLSRVYSVAFIGKLHKKICEIENFQYTNIASSLTALHDKYDQEAIAIMQQIEKELKGE